MKLQVAPPLCKILTFNHGWINQTRMWTKAEKICHQCNLSIVYTTHCIQPGLCQDFVHIETEPRPPLKKEATSLTVFSEENFNDYFHDTLELTLNRTLALGHFGEKARYKAYPNAILAEKYYELAEEPACVALHSTVDLLPEIHQYIKNWQGSVSFAIFAPSYQFYAAIVYIKHLRKCNPAVRNQVTWHLAYPKLLQPPLHLSGMLTIEFNCSISDKEILLNLQKPANNSGESIPGDLLYPQNEMRNLARRHCKSQWVMCPDIDMVFPDHDPQAPTMHSRLNAFLVSPEARKCEKCAFVFPLYELENVNNQSKVPESKKVLLEYVANKNAQIYHGDYFPENQGSSKLDAWEKLPLTDVVKVAGDEIEYNWWYEPVYIARQGVPNFDERYIGYGMTRNTQALEMHLQGYSFFLLDTIFLSHLWGFKRTVKNKYNKLTDKNSPRRLQTEHNAELFYAYAVRELSIRYDTDLKSIYKKRQYDSKLKVGLHVNSFKKNEVKQKKYKELLKSLNEIPGTKGF